MKSDISLCECFSENFGPERAEVAYITELRLQQTILVIKSGMMIQVERLAVR
jgi:hypothetical protein